jgi:3-oxoacyl-[acyl-carrier protein] reductase
VTQLQIALLTRRLMSAYAVGLVCAHVLDPDAHGAPAGQRLQCIEVLVAVAVVAASRVTLDRAYRPDLFVGAQRRLAQPVASGHILAGAALPPRRVGLSAARRSSGWSQCVGFEKGCETTRISGTRPCDRSATAWGPPLLVTLHEGGPKGRVTGMSARFDGKTVVITGGGAGIGRCYAHRFAEEGANLVIADVDSAVGDRVVKEIEDMGRQGLSRPVDVTDEKAVTAMTGAAADRFGGIDILVNNAGIHLGHAQLPFTVEAVPQWRNVLNVNVIGALICAAACRPSMAERGGGSIINHSSMAAYIGGGAYGVSKLALNSLTVGLAADFASDRIRVNGIAPGLVDSEAAIEWMNDPQRAGIQQMLIGGQLIKRPGTMEDLANMALFLCSEEASFVTGQTILVDGGHTKKPF